MQQGTIVEVAHPTESSAPSEVGEDGVISNHETQSVPDFATSAAEREEDGDYLTTDGTVLMPWLTEENKKIPRGVYRNQFHDLIVVEDDFLDAFFPDSSFWGACDEGTLSVKMLPQETRNYPVAIADHGLRPITNSEYITTLGDSTAQAAQIATLMYTYLTNNICWRFDVAQEQIVPALTHDFEDWVVETYIANGADVQGCIATDKAFVYATGSCPRVRARGYVCVTAKDPALMESQGLKSGVWHYRDLEYVFSKPVTQAEMGSLPEKLLIDAILFTDWVEVPDEQLDDVLALRDSCMSLIENYCNVG